ncbi:MAG: energy transducer TonB [Sphingomicrobium sp.]
MNQASLRLVKRAHGDLVGLFSSDDYPNEALQKRETGTVKVRLTIGVDGRISACEVTLSSLSPSLDAATCRVITDRARFEPARDRAGRPVPDSYVQRITWKLPPLLPEPFADHLSRTIVAVHGDGHADCKLVVGEKVVPVDLTTCDGWRERTVQAMALLPVAVAAPYRATLKVEMLVGEGLPLIPNEAMAVRSATRMRIDSAGRVTACQPIMEAMVNGHDAIDLCSHIDTMRFVPLPAAQKNRGDRAMVFVRTLTFEPGQ